MQQSIRGSIEESIGGSIGEIEGEKTSEARAVSVLMRELYFTLKL